MEGIILNQSLQIKFKIIFLLFILPILIGVLFVFLFLDLSLFAKLAIIFSIFIGVVLGHIFRDRKYIYSLLIQSDRIQIKYYTPLLFSKIHEFNTISIVNAEVTKPNWLIQYPSAVNFNYNGAWFEYQILNRLLENFIKDNLNSFGMNQTKLPLR